MAVHPRVAVCQDTGQAGQALLPTVSRKVTIPDLSDIAPDIAWEAERELISPP